MRAAALAIFLVMTGPGWGNPPVPGSMHVEFAGQTLMCDTLQQIKDVATAPVDSQDEVLAGYESILDAKGEPTCDIQPVTAYDVTEVVHLGNLYIGSDDRPMDAWAVHFQGSGFGQDGWALWGETIEPPKGKGA